VAPISIIADGPFRVLPLISGSHGSLDVNCGERSRSGFCRGLIFDTVDPNGAVRIHFYVRISGAGWGDGSGSERGTIARSFPNRALASDGVRWRETFHFTTRRDAEFDGVP
jgi:hypothetical protein